MDSDGTEVAKATISISPGLRDKLRTLKAERGGLTYDQILRSELSIELEK